MYSLSGAIVSVRYKKRKKSFDFSRFFILRFYFSGASSRVMGAASAKLL